MSSRSSRSNGFTLVEVLVTITIIGILTAMFLGALQASQNKAKESRTQSMISRLDTVMLTRWESYRTRRVPFNGSNATQAAWSMGRGWNPATTVGVSRARLEVLRYLQRLELPQRWEDVAADPAAWPNATSALIDTTSDAAAIATPALNFAYLRAFNQNTTSSYNGTTTTSVAAQPSDDYAGAECLYLIVTSGAIEEDASPIDQFRAMDVGDFDRDGMKEFQDGWGNPISFIRWPAPLMICTRCADL